MSCINTLGNETRSAVIRRLVDGNSIRATTRITGAAKNTIQNLTRDQGDECLKFCDSALRNRSPTTISSASIKR